MKVKSEHLFLGWILLGLLSFSSVGAFNKSHAFGALIFEGLSFGKLLIFFTWQIAFFGLISVFKKFKPKKTLFFLKGFVAVILIGYLLGVLAQQLLFINYSVGPTAVIGVLTLQDGNLAWQASHLKHTHVPKVSLGFAQTMSGIIISSADSGIPLFQIVPFSSFWAIIFLALFFSGIYFVFAHGVHYYSRKFSGSSILFGIVSYGLMITMLDGGILTQGAVVNLSLLLLYLIIEFFPKKEFKVMATMFGPLSIVIAIQIFLSSLIGGYFGRFIHLTNSYNITLAASFLAAFFLLRKKKTAFGLVLIFVVLVSLMPVIRSASDLEFGSVSGPDEDVSFFIYGLPPETSDSEILTILSRHGEVVSFERQEWVALFDYKTTEKVSNKIMEEELRSELNPSTYLYVLRLFNENTLTVTNTSDKVSLKGFSSEFIDVIEIREDDLGREQIKIKTRLSPVWANLYFLDYIRINGGDVPVVLITE